MVTTPAFCRFDSHVTNKHRDTSDCRVSQKRPRIVWVPLIPHLCAEVSHCEFDLHVLDQQLKVFREVWIDYEPSDAPDDDKHQRAPFKPEFSYCNRDDPEKCGQNEKQKQVVCPRKHEGEREQRP